MPTVLAPAIRTSQFSFVRFTDQHLDDTDWNEKQVPGASMGYALPVSRPDDLMYQFIWESDDIGDVDGFCALALSTIQFKIARGANSGPVITAAQFAALPSAGTFNGVQLAIEKYRMNDNQVLIFVPKISNIGLFNSLSEGECFQIAVLTPGDGLDLTGISNAFYYSTDTDFSSLIDYYSSYDEADFYYCIAPTLKNRVRLWLYPTRPDYPEDESIYRRSDGTTLIQRAVVREVFEVEAKEMPAWAIKSLRAILLHDERYIDSNAYTGYFGKEGPFNIDWPDFLNYPFGTPSFKIASDTNLMKNNNCGDCEEYEPLALQNTYFFTGVAGFQTLTLNLNTQILSGGCCAPMVFHVLSQNTSPGIILSYTLSTAGVLTINIGSVPGGSHTTFLLFTVNATCAGTSNTLTINAITP